MKRFPENVYYKQLKNGRLKLLIKLYLRYCGKRDARKKVIRKNADGEYLSPFICREIHLYNLAFRVEEERFIRAISLTEADSQVFQLQIDRKEELIGKIQNDTGLSFDERVGLEQPITILEAKRLELSFFKEKEEKIKQLRCEQLYCILQARILSYWEGVLQVYGEDVKIPPIASIEYLIQGGKEIHEKRQWIS